jgi:hypothetical protein
MWHTSNHPNCMKNKFLKINYNFKTNIYNNLLKLNKIKKNHKVINKPKGYRLKHIKLKINL